MTIPKKFVLLNLQRYIWYTCNKLDDKVGTLNLKGIKKLPNLWTLNDMNHWHSLISLLWQKCFFFSFTQGEKEYKTDKALTVYLKIFYFEVNESNLGVKKKKQNSDSLNRLETNTAYRKDSSPVKWAGTRRTNPPKHKSLHNFQLAWGILGNEIWRKNNWNIFLVGNKPYSLPRTAFLSNRKNCSDNHNVLVLTLKHKINICLVEHFTWVKESSHT